MLRPLMRPSLRQLQACYRSWIWSSDASVKSSSTQGQTETRKASDPLHILFCGSDEFSCFSLRALHDEKQRNGDLIRSIDVVVRPPKPTGRGNKIVQKSPLHMLAEELSLDIYARDTFTGWQPPQRDGVGAINLIVAVSFGLFVPRRLLRAAKYGGLNVHPSLLPDLRGPAPLQHALLAGDRYTGVSLQTLSEEAFDAGIVLSRSSLVAIPGGTTVPQLRDLLAPIGAELLVSSLRAGAHVPPLAPAADANHSSLPDSSRRYRTAPKITTADRQAEWTGPRACSAANMAVRARVLGPLWSRALRRDGEERRLILEGVEDVPSDEWPEEVVLFLRTTSEVAKKQQDQHGSTSDSSVKGKVENTHAGGAKAAGMEVQTVTWIQDVQAEKHGTSEASPMRRRVQVTIPFFSQGDHIFIPLARGGCIRVRDIKVEGEKSKAAAKAIEPFSTNLPSDGKGGSSGDFGIADALWFPVQGMLESILP
ncbi:hypothetical protein VTK73DRAFT_6703 [Phialemonium thermophilum]|uniref:methionyl-tRNA formyltransferase n=1 Tax=Phialemonium thermophilum TaxID=223376 RepID=A0ABR3XV50_9PEZI